MKYAILLIVFSYGVVFSQSQQDSIQFRKIANEILTNGQGYELLRTLTKKIGHRLSGTKSYEDAVRWGRRSLKEAGADSVWLQPVIVPHWERGRESLEIQIGDGKWENVNLLSLGNTEGTKGKDLIAELIVVQNFEEFNALKAEEVKGKAVLFNYAFRQDFIQTFSGYGDAVSYRWAAPFKVQEKGGVATFVRSVSTAFDDVPHTGTTDRKGGALVTPAVALGPLTSQRLADISGKEKIRIKLNSEATMKKEVSSYQVIGEIRGKDEQVIVVGGHLDSWDVGEGAHDDGAGVVQAIEVIRTFKTLGIQPNHTIRAVLFANEENGSRGSITYLDSAKAKNEPHLFALESDIGGFSPRGFSLEMSPKKSTAVKKWIPLFEPYGAGEMVDSYSGEDVGRLREIGAECAGFMPDSQRYFDLHHSNSDIFQEVNRRELLLGATVMTQLIYMVDKYW